MVAQQSARDLYTERSAAYHRFVAAVRYPQGLRAAFRQFAPLRAGMKVLDAGCGGGLVTFALREALSARGLRPGVLHGFDLTPAMLDRFRAGLEERGMSDVELRQANVLSLDTLPDAWQSYDLIVSSAMLEYLPGPSCPRRCAGCG
jgi:ubiquinone/menaquinone biosynthesis C-methylase UbiE